MVVVAGPRIDPASFPRRDGLEVRAYVHELCRHLAACDLAIVQGGLDDLMELAASEAPLHLLPARATTSSSSSTCVTGSSATAPAGRMDFATSSPPGARGKPSPRRSEREVAYRDVETDGAARAAALIAEVL